MLVLVYVYIDFVVVKKIYFVVEGGVSIIIDGGIMVQCLGIIIIYVSKKKFSGLMSLSWEMNIWFEM